MGVAHENRFKAKSLREFHAESARKPLDIEGHLENRLTVAEATIAELRAALEAAEGARAEAERGQAAGVAALAAAERTAALWKRFAMGWRRRVESLERAHRKLSTIIRWGLSPDRYHDLGADYDRENGDGNERDN